MNFLCTQEKLEKLCEGPDKPHLPTVEGMDKAQIAFRLTDTNRDGYVDESEFEKMAKNLTKDKVKKAFVNCDKNKDGKLDFKEFKEMMDIKKKKQASK